MITKTFLSQAKTPSTHRDTLLIVGNGISINLRDQFSGRLKNWDTRSPLGWRVHNPSDKSQDLIDALPEFKQELARLRAQFPEAKDFQLLTQIARKATTEPYSSGPALEARHWIVNAFSQYQQRADYYNQLHSWKWRCFLDNHGHRIAAVVSFNYDLNIESALEAAGLHPVALAAATAKGLHINRDSVPVYKPHGSIDYTAMGNVIKTTPKYPLHTRMSDNNYPVDLLSRHNLNTARVFADVILPGETNRFSTFQWVAHPKSRILTQASRAANVVLAGISFGEPDRPELQELLRFLPRSANAHVVDPSPNPELMELLEQRFSKLEHISRDLTQIRLPATPAKDSPPTANPA